MMQTFHGVDKHTLRILIHKNHFCAFGEFTTRLTDPQWFSQHQSCVEKKFISYYDLIRLFPIHTESEIQRNDPIKAVPIQIWDIFIKNHT
jgi:hypothetical protein